MCVDNTVFDGPQHSPRVNCSTCWFHIPTVISVHTSQLLHEHSPLCCDQGKLYAIVSAECQSILVEVR